MDSPARTRLDTDARRAQLLELGLALFGDRSYEDVSIDDIARAAGVSKGLLYHYFGGKRDFYVACVREAAQRLLEATQPPDDVEPAQRARHGLAAYLDFVDARAPAYRALMHGGIGRDREVAALVEDVRSRFLHRLLVGAGLAETHPIHRVAMRGWLGAVEAMSLDWLTHRDLARDALEALLLATLAETVRRAADLDPAPAD